MRSYKPGAQFDKSQQLKCCDLLCRVETQQINESIKVKTNKDHNRKNKSKIFTVTVAPNYKHQNQSFVYKTNKFNNFHDNTSLSSSIKLLVQDNKSQCATVLDSNHRFCQPSQVSSVISQDTPQIYQGSRTLSFLFQSINTQL